MEVRISQTEEVVIVEKKEYVADDGTVFNRWVDCEEYEKELRYKVLENFKTVDLAPPSEYDYYYFNWYYIESEKDLKILEEFVDDDNIECDTFPQWIGVATNYDNENWVFGTLEDYLEKMVNLKTH